MDFVAGVHPVPTTYFWSILASFGADDPHWNIVTAVAGALADARNVNHALPPPQTLTTLCGTHLCASAMTRERDSPGHGTPGVLAAPRIFRLGDARTPCFQHGPRPCVPGPSRERHQRIDTSSMRGLVGWTKRMAVFPRVACSTRLLCRGMRWRFSRARI